MPGLQKKKTGVTWCANWQQLIRWITRSLGNYQRRGKKRLQEQERQHRQLGPKGIIFSRIFSVSSGLQRGSIKALNRGPLMFRLKPRLV